MNSMKIAAALCLLVAAGCHSEDGACGRIYEACHDLDPGTGPIHDCHEDSEAETATEESCAAMEDDCLAICKP